MIWVLAQIIGFLRNAHQNSSSLILANLYLENLEETREERVPPKWAPRITSNIVYVI